jgi:hypothetical protein
LAERARIAEGLASLGLEEAHGALIAILTTGVVVEAARSTRLARLELWFVTVSARRTLFANGFSSEVLEGSQSTVAACLTSHVVETAVVALSNKHNKLSESDHKREEKIEQTC